MTVRDVYIVLNMSFSVNLMNSSGNILSLSKLCRK